MNQKFEDVSDRECLGLIFPGAARINYPLALMGECNTENTPMKKKIVLCSDGSSKREFFLRKNRLC